VYVRIRQDTTSGVLPAMESLHFDGDHSLADLPSLSQCVGNDPWLDGNAIQRPEREQGSWQCATRRLSPFSSLTYCTDRSICREGGGWLGYRTSDPLPQRDHCRTHSPSYCYRYRASRLTLSSHVSETLPARFFQEIFVPADGYGAHSGVSSVHVESPLVSIFLEP
jgi:hypothetical protein